VQNKNLQGILSQKKSHMGISLRVRASSQNINQTNHSSLSDILLSKFPQFKVEKLKMKICKGFPSDGFRHRHIT
jgi:anti-sigma28 factor (negative regulator of flagellin synthesis)